MSTRALPAPVHRTRMAAPPLRWGVLAPGWIAGQFAAALRRGTRQEIVAVGSRSSTGRAPSPRNTAHATAYGSYEELVHDPQVDIVYIASPHSEHHRPSPARPGGGQARPGGEGLHPQRHRGPRPHRPRTRAEACSCSKACGAGSCPTTTSCGQALQDGLIGEVTTVFADHGQHLYPTAPTGCRTRTWPAARCSTSAVYPISFADFVLGAFTSITATGTLTDHGVDSQETPHRRQPGRRARRPTRLHARRRHPARPRSAAPRAGWTSAALLHPDLGPVARP